MQRVKRFLLATAALASAFILLLSVWLFLAPRADTVWYRFEDGQTGQSTFPLAVASNGPYMNINFSLRLRLLHPKKFTVVPDDCLEIMAVNGQTVPIPEEIFACATPGGRTIDLSPYIHTGDNDVFVRVRDNGGMGGFNLRVAPSDPLAIAFLIVVLLCTAGYGVYLFWYRRDDAYDPAVFVALGFGFVIRLLYVFLTPYTERAHDIDGHIEYIRFVAAHFTLPDPNAGWQMYQPPLYYFLTGGLWRLGELIGLQAVQLLQLMQWFSFFLSIVALAAVAWLATFLFKGAQSAWERFLFVGGFAVFPGIVYQASRINNDALLLTLVAVGFALLLALFHKPQWKTAIALFVVSGLLVITKTNGVLFIVAAFLSLPFLPKTSWKKKVGLMASGVLIVCLLGGWFHAVRILGAPESTDNVVVGNLETLSSDLRIRNSWKSVLVFNPIAVVKHPFNNVWIDSERRQYFWEFFVRSSLSGEFNFGDVMEPFASFLLILWMFVIPVAVVGLIKQKRLRGWQQIPLLAVFSILLIGHVLFSFKAPYAPTQDFRYTSIVLLPFLFYALSASDFYPRITKWYVRGLILGVSITSLEFLLLLLYLTS
jgi:4-amino-4-deoxy-L-arabinose transferase-like glycosyltransferase